MSILENNFHQAYKTISDLVEKEKEESAILKAKHIIVQVAYQEESFELFSASLTPSEDGIINDELATDKYYNMVFIAEGIEDVLHRFKDKYLFKLAYADISFALHTAYRNALMSESGEFTLHTSFFKPSIEDSVWAYKDVFHYSDLGHFRCWFNFDDDFKQVDIQADNDLIIQYNELDPKKKTLL